ncbi:MAG: hypothetical protein R6V53_07230 [Candidatus Woesearchaeota archaeon]
MIESISLTTEAQEILEQKLCEYELRLVNRMAETGQSFECVCATTGAGWRYLLGRTLYQDMYVDVREQFQKFQQNPVFKKNPGAMPDQDDFYHAAEILHEWLYNDGKRCHKRSL